MCMVHTIGNVVHVMNIAPADVEQGAKLQSTDQSNCQYGYGATHEDAAEVFKCDMLACKL